MSVLLGIVAGAMPKSNSIPLLGKIYEFLLAEDQLFHA